MESISVKSRRNKSCLTSAAIACLLCFTTCNTLCVTAFSPAIKPVQMKCFKEFTTSLFSETLDGPAIGFDGSCLMTREEIAPIITLKKGTPSEKFINSYGLYCILITIILNPIWSLAMTITDAICRMFPDLDVHRSFYDKTGKIWSKVWLTLSDSFPSISGDVDRLKEENDLGACLFVANHSSWYDILLLCTVLDPVFKFIAKGELRSVPCIGQQLVGGKHILIDREDRKSQLRTFKEGVQWLKDGVPLMAFPEGKRSHDGRLMPFKGGIFSMAVKAGVPIVPISISNAHAIMPSAALFPVQKGKGKLHIHVHPPISIEGKSESELADLVKVALLSKMPLEQHPLSFEAECDQDLVTVEKEIVSSILSTTSSTEKDIQKSTDDLSATQNC